MTTSSYEAMTLRKHLKRCGRLEADEVVRIGAEIMSGIAHLHEKDLVHQDIKPENILSIDGVRRLADFGLLGREGGRRGYTPGYNPPDGDIGSPYHDQYALGVTLFALLTGQPSGHSSRIQMQQDLESETDSRRRNLLECILCLCSNSPPRGFVSDSDALTKLRQIASSSPAAARGARPSSAIRWSTEIVAGLFVIASAVALLAWWGPNAPKPDPTEPPIAGVASPLPFAFGELIQDAYVEVYRASPDNPEAVQPMGRLAPGAPVPGAVSEGDALRFIARFNEPAYVYLVALAASGGEEFLCWPESESAAPPQIESLAYPPPGPAGEQVLWNLEEGPGLHAFALVASAEPLPPFEQMERRRWHAPMAREHGAGAGRWSRRPHADGPDAWGRAAARCIPGPGRAPGSARPDRVTVGPPPPPRRLSGADRVCGACPACQVAGRRGIRPLTGEAIARLISGGVFGMMSRAKTGGTA